MALFYLYENLSFIWQTVARCAKVLLMDVLFVCLKMTYESLVTIVIYRDAGYCLSLVNPWHGFVQPSYKKKLNVQSHCFFQSPVINFIQQSHDELEISICGNC